MVFFSCRAALTDLAESTSSLFHAPFVPFFLIFRFLFELPLSPCTLPLHAIFLDLTTKYRRLEGGRGGGRRGPVGREARCYDYERACAVFSSSLADTKTRDSFFPLFTSCLYQYVVRTHGATAFGVLLRSLSPPFFPHVLDLLLGFFLVFATCTSPKFLFFSSFSSCFGFGH